MPGSKQRGESVPKGPSEQQRAAGALRSLGQQNENETFFSGSRRSGRTPPLRAECLVPESATPSAFKLACTQDPGEGTLALLTDKETGAQREDTSNPRLPGQHTGKC